MRVFDKLEEGRQGSEDGATISYMCPNELLWKWDYYSQFAVGYVRELIPLQFYCAQVMMGPFLVVTVPNLIIFSGTVERAKLCIKDLDLHKVFPVT